MSRRLLPNGGLVLLREQLAVRRHTRRLLPGKLGRLRRSRSGSSSTSEDERRLNDHGGLSRGGSTTPGPEDERRWLLLGNRVSNRLLSREGLVLLRLAPRFRTQCLCSRRSWVSLKKLSIVDILSKYILAGASVNASVLWNEKSRESYFPLFLIRVAMTALWSPKSSLTCSTSTGIQSNRKLSLQKM